MDLLWGAILWLMLPQSGGGTFLINEKFVRLLVAGAATGDRIGSDGMGWDGQRPPFWSTSSRRTMKHNRYTLTVGDRRLRLPFSGTPAQWPGRCTVLWESYIYVSVYV